MSVIISMNNLIRNKQRITAVSLEVLNAQGHHTLKVWFNDTAYTVSTLRKPFESKVYKSLHASLSDVLKLGFNKAEVNYNVL